MINFQKLSETEMEVMQVIWDSGKPITSSELLNFFTGKGKEWKGQTIATFLARLVDKGVLNAKKQGRANIYEARMSLEEYKSKEAKSLLHTHYKGSVKNFLVTLYNGEDITKGELAELRSWFSKKAGEENE